jgi:ribosomal protein S18 acetylase RimI-like enzyme
MSLPDARTAVDAFFGTVAHRCAVVDGSSARRIGELCLLDEAITHQNPFPRAFPFRKSFYALAAEPQSILDPLQGLLEQPEEGHILNLFSDDPEAETTRWQPLGYELSWSWDLYARAIPPVRADGHAAPGDLGPGDLETRDLETVVVDSESLVSAINANSPEYPSSSATLDDERIIELALCEAGRPVAKGEIILQAPDFVHVMGMVTIPSHRRSGLGRAVMEALLARGRAAGARFAVLNASLEASRIGFYPKLGFSPVIRCARLTPAA